MTQQLDVTVLLFIFQEKLFLTMSNVKKELDRLDSEQGAMPTAANECENSPELEVTDMDQDKLIVQIKVRRSWDVMCVIELALCNSSMNYTLFFFPT